MLQTLILFSFTFRYHFETLLILWTHPYLREGVRECEIKSDRGVQRTTFVAYPIAKFMGSTRGPTGSCRIQIGPILTTWTLLSGILAYIEPSIYRDRGACKKSAGKWFNYDKWYGKHNRNVMHDVVMYYSHIHTFIGWYNMENNSMTGYSCTTEFVMLTINVW